MRATIQSFGWYVRRDANPEAVTAFYRDVIGLPALRHGPPVTMFWLGEIFSFECLLGGSPRPSSFDPAQAPMVPVMRLHDAAPLRRRLQNAGVPMVGDVAGPDGQGFSVVDPSGSMMGFHECAPDSPFAEDREARRRWEAGLVPLPGVAPLPAGLHALGWVLMRVADVARQTAFYRDTLGLDVVRTTRDEAWLSLGETALLGLLPGGVPAPFPADRSEVNETFILRVWDLDGIVADLLRHGVRFVTAPFDIPGGRLAYFADPEGRTIGLQQRTPASERVEDGEAARRWAARLS
ncbi:MAG: hypothetical protein KatS3mg060_0328 [Dehalococcoidia bacterium]|nr:MAG: hypothetical protein KatS3mg060_0328 [Dehalococcoidia bacterium]